jgi:hypothetical protein
MTRALLGFLVLSLPLASACSRHGRHAWREGGGMESPFRPRDQPWPMVRIAEPQGALVVMERGVFGEGISATAPLEGRFQPTSPSAAGGYPLELRLEGTAAQRVGSDKPIVIYARLTVREAMSRQGTLVIAPTECALRALVDGDLDELRVTAEALPTADQACAIAAKAAAGGACPMHAGQECPMHAGQQCPMHAGQQCPMHAGQGCPMGGGAKQGCDKHGCGGGRRGHWPWSAGPAAELILRLTKF